MDFHSGFNPVGAVFFHSNNLRANAQFRLLFNAEGGTAFHAAANLCRHSGNLMA
jgi:hypothetical protein